MRAGRFSCSLRFDHSQIEAITFYGSTDEEAREAARQFVATIKAGEYRVTVADTEKPVKL